MGDLFLTKKYRRLTNAANQETLTYLRVFPARNPPTGNLVSY